MWHLTDNVVAGGDGGVFAGFFVVGFVVARRSYQILPQERGTKDSGTVSRKTSK